MPEMGLPPDHKATHQDGGSDELSVLGLSGLLGDSQTPLAHKASHQDIGTDEISVAGLSGELADDQPPKKIFGSITLKGDPQNTWTISNPGTTYTEATDTLGTSLDLDKLPTGCYYRLVVTCRGNEAGNYGFRAWNTNDGEAICVVEWNDATGNTVKYQFAGSWTQYTKTGDKDIRIEVKAASATADVDLWYIELQIARSG